MRLIAVWVWAGWPLEAGNVCELMSFQFFPANVIVDVPDSCRTPLVRCWYVAFTRPECARATRDAFAIRCTIDAVSTTFFPGRGASPPPVATSTATTSAAAMAGAARMLICNPRDRLDRRRRRWLRNSADGSTVATSCRSWVRSWSASCSSVSMMHLRCAAAVSSGHVVEDDAKAGQRTGGVGLHRSLRDAEQRSGLGHR